MVFVFAYNIEYMKVAIYDNSIDIISTYFFYQQLAHL